MKQTIVASSRKTANVHLNIIYNSEYKNEKDIKVMFFSIESRSVQKHLHWRQNVENMKIIFVDQNKDNSTPSNWQSIQLPEQRRLIWREVCYLVGNHCQPLSTIVNQKSCYHDINLINSLRRHCDQSSSIALLLCAWDGFKCWHCRDGMLPSIGEIPATKMHSIALQWLPWDVRYLWRPVGQHFHIV